MLYVDSHANQHRSVAWIYWHIYGYAYDFFCKLTKLNLNDIEIFISYFIPLIFFLLLFLHGDIESNPGPKKKEQTYFSLCHWNVNSSVAHKKYLYQLHIILSTDMTLFVYQRVFQIQPYLMMTIFFTWRDIILLEQIILIT